MSENRLTWLKDIPIRPWMIEEGGCLDMDACPDCWERNAHLERYGFACEALRGSTVLDFGCGVGYGSEMLARAGNAVTGCDSSERALAWARRRRGALAQFVLPDDAEARRPFHAVVAFEVMEHLEDPAAFLGDMADRCGHVILSTPIVPTMANNPWHKQDFTAAQVRELVGKRFHIRCEWTQARPWRSEPSYLVIHGARK